MRYVYLDEAGISNPKHEPYMVIAGVIIHGDSQWRPLEERLRKIASDEGLPEDFVFHATEIFSGGKTLDRENWPRERRWKILDRLVAIPVEFGLPVAIGRIKREGFPRNADTRVNRTEADLFMLAYASIFSACTTMIERWLHTYAADEVATIVAEDTPKVKGRMKDLHQMFQDPKLEQILQERILPQYRQYMPYTKIVDTVHYASKQHSRLLQLADICAFCLKRGLMGTPDSERFARPIARNLIAVPPELTEHFKASV